MKLPQDHKPYIDKYFLRSKDILQKENLNPTVKLQVFMRKADCNIYGIDEAIEIIKTYAPNATIYSLQEGDHADPCETIMVIEGKVQDIIDLETMYLGVISAETTKKVDNRDINLEEIELGMKAVVDLAGTRPVMYMGARHWRWDMDAEISQACFKGGAAECSTDIGAATVGKKGAGTIPHALEAVFHWQMRDISLAVLGAIRAFDKHILKEVPRIALVDYANQEIWDTIRCQMHLQERLWGIRIDTCGENYMEGVMPYIGSGIASKGVSLKGVYLIRKMLNDAHLDKVNICLSSGFANPEKVKLFVDAEKELGMRLFDMLGIGQVFYSRVTTGDIIEVEGESIHKVGRPYRPNPRLRQVA